MLVQSRRLLALVVVSSVIGCGSGEDGSSLSENSPGGGASNAGSGGSSALAGHGGTASAGAAGSAGAHVAGSGGSSGSNVGGSGAGGEAGHASGSGGASGASIGGAAGAGGSANAGAADAGAAGDATGGVGGGSTAGAGGDAAGGAAGTTSGGSGGDAAGGALGGAGGASAGAGGSDVSNGAIDPIVVGNSWTYDVTELGIYPLCPSGSSSGVVLSQGPHDGMTDALAVQSLCQGVGTVYYDVQGDQVQEDILGTWELALAAPVQDGQSWSNGTESYTWHEMGSVTVPAGTFDQCFSAAEDAGETFTIFCRGVGPIHWHYVLGGNGYDAVMTSKNF